MEFLREEGYRTGLLVCFDNKIAYIATPLQADYLGGEQVRAGVQAENNV